MSATLGSILTPRTLQDIDFSKFAQVREQRGGRQLILIYTEPERAGDIEEVVLNMQGYLLDATLPPIRQHKYVAWDL